MTNALADAVWKPEAVCMTTLQVSLSLFLTEEARLTVMFAGNLLQQVALIETVEEDWLQPLFFVDRSLLFSPDQDRNRVLCDDIGHGVEDPGKDGASAEGYENKYMCQWRKTYI